jgi:hypothetical protein
VFGLWVYAAAVVAYALWSRRRGAGGDSGRHGAVAGRTVRTDAGLLATLATLYTVGSVGRLLAVASGSAGSAGDVASANAIVSFVAQLATAGTIGLIVYVRSPDRRVTAAVNGGLLVLELMWTVAVESKTPIMGASLALAVRFAIQGWTRRRLAAIVLVAFAGIAGFGWLQGLKQSDDARAVSAVIDSRYPPSVQPFLSILRRFDLLEAATDSYYVGGRQWLSPGQVVQYSLESLVPAPVLGAVKFRSGTAWAVQVRGSSVDMTRVSVSLADGNVNEGNVLGGYPGVAADVLFTLGLLLFTVRALHARHIAVITLGLALTASPVLFERGILGSMETVGKSLQLVAVVWLVDVVVREFRRRTAESGKTPLVRLGTGAGGGTGARG